MFQSQFVKMLLDAGVDPKEGKCASKQVNDIPMWVGALVGTPKLIVNAEAPKPAVTVVDPTDERAMRRQQLQREADALAAEAAAAAAESSGSE
jgi:hypothetical protein